MAKLPVEAQGRILLAAIQVLESAGWTRKAGQQGGGVPAGPGPASHQPFKQLVLACVRGQEEQRDDLVSSLQVQFQQFLSKDSKDVSVEGGGKCWNAGAYIECGAVGVWCFVGL